MKVVVAIDSLKGSLSSIEAGQAIKEGILRVDSHATVEVRPLADGGEGTVEALVEGMNGNYQEVTVHGPLNDKVKAQYGIIKESHTAIIEMASAAGITLISDDQKNPMKTSTYGVGEIIKDAINQGCRRFIIGIGGSVTNDGGVGMLQALGFDFLDKNNQPIQLGAQGLKDLVSIKDSHAIKELADCEFMIACDVTNPLCGDNGASAIFGPQKGADDRMVKELDQLLYHLSEVSKEYNKDSDALYPGTGAAGGLGFAFYNFLHGHLQSGINLILKETHLEKYMEGADVVVTGEGRLDNQTAMGKAPIGVARLAKKYHLDVLAFAGSVTEGARDCLDKGIDAYFSILREVAPLEKVIEKEYARKNMTNTVEQVFRVYCLNNR